MLSFLVDNYLNWLPSLKSIILPGFAGRLTESTQQIDCSVWFTFWKRMVSKAWKIWHYSCRKCTDIHEEKPLNCIFCVLRQNKNKEYLQGKSGCPASQESQKVRKVRKSQYFDEKCQKVSKMSVKLMKIQQSQEKVRKNMMLMPSQKISHTVIIEETVCVCVSLCLVVSARNYSDGCMYVVCVSISCCFHCT